MDTKRWLALGACALLFACADDGDGSGEETPGAGASDVAQGDAGMSDAAVDDVAEGADTREEADVRADAASVEIVPFTISFDAEGDVAVGVEVCVLEYPELGCGRTNMLESATLDVPAGEPFHLQVNDERFQATLTPMAPITEASSLGNWFLPRPSTVAIAAAAVGEDFDRDAGALALQVEGATDRDALIGVEVELIGDAQTYYFDAAGVPDLSLEGLSLERRAGFLNLPPGDYMVRVNVAEMCRGEFGTGLLVEGESNTFAARVEAGYLTTFLAYCPVPGREGRECDFMAQDCADGQKCRVTVFRNTGGFNDYGTRCVDPGPDELGDTCERVDEPGDDTCEAGAYCGNYGQSPGEARLCRAHCTLNQHCPEGQVCLGLGYISGGGDMPGACVDACDPFEESTCNEGASCKVFSTATLDQAGQEPICWLDTDERIGEDCTNSDCAAGLTCTNFGSPAEPTCRLPCDDAHPCETGTCTRFAAPYDAYGFCVE